MSDAPELLPCPFCGEQAVFERIGDRRASTIVACTMCGCRHECGEEWGHGSSWNRRAPDPRVAALVEACEAWGMHIAPEDATGADPFRDIRAALAAFKGGADG